ncbi:MAG: glycosyltransferase [Verrucomicrobiales bacterium]|mgnify:CR=1 FL=1|nr:glycosyltransferase [Verrucomicrobiales bacterium]|tara:strand:+ start:4545 stop:5225 length:681 start_codon:yes stop_codon:yes gene_type:complete
MPTISILIPTLNEETSLPETLARAQAIPEVSEIILGDGGSTDGTCDIARDAGARVVQSPCGRGTQLRAAADVATGNVVLLLHADTWLPPHAGVAAIELLGRPNMIAGAFWRRFTEGAPLLMRGARLKSWLLLHSLGYVYGDQAIFLTRTTLERIGGVPDVPLMEDVILCERLREKGRIGLANASATTSWRKFEKLGVLNTYLLMARVLSAYRRGVPPEKLRELYYS